MNKNKRNALMAVLRGEKADKPPFTIYEWLVPDGHKNAPWVNSSLTLIGACSSVGRRFAGVEVVKEEIRERGERKTLLRYVTPSGELRKKTAYDPTLGSAWIEEHPVKTTADMELIGQIYGAIELPLNRGGMADSVRRMGDKGIVLDTLPPVPVVEMWVELMGPVLWSEALLTERRLFAELHDIIKKAYLKQVELVAAGSAEVVWLPDNVTAAMVSPDTYREFCLPVYAEACAMLKASGKLSFAHYDGDNLPLKELIGGTGIDIIEAFTPPPMSRMSVRDARLAWPDKVLSMNFPGNLFGEKEEVIRSHAARYLAEGMSDPFVIGCTEEFAVKHFARAFQAIAEALESGTWRVGA